MTAEAKAVNFGIKWAESVELCGRQHEQKQTEQVCFTRSLVPFNSKIYSHTTLTDADLSEAKLVRVDLSGSQLGRANSNGITMRMSLNMNATKITSVKGLTKEQLEASKAQGAIIDEDATTSSPQPTVAAPTSQQSNNAQVSSAPAAQGSPPTPETGKRTI